jgi:hypothetical protein
VTRKGGEGAAQQPGAQDPALPGPGAQRPWSEFSSASAAARSAKRDEALVELRAALASPEGFADRAAAEALLNSLQGR